MGRREFEHGTVSRYRQGCRCEECRAANTRELRKWRADNPEKVMEIYSRSKARVKAGAESAGISTYVYKGAKALHDRKRADPSLIPEHVHGTVNGYSNHQCRCEECRAAWAAEVARTKDQRASRPIPEHVHGTENGYGNYKCRCDECTKAWSAASIARYRRRREKG